MTRTSQTKSPEPGAPAAQEPRAPQLLAARVLLRAPVLRVAPAQRLRAEQAEQAAKPALARVGPDKLARQPEFLVPVALVVWLVRI